MFSRGQKIVCVNTEWVKPPRELAIHKNMPMPEKGGIYTVDKPDGANAVYLVEWGGLFVSFYNWHFKPVQDNSKGMAMLRKQLKQPKPERVLQPVNTALLAIITEMDDDRTV